MSFFRAVTSGTQSISNLVETELTFGTELSDPDGVFASGRFTVPSGWNGRVGGMTAGFLTNNFEATMHLRIQLSTDSGSSWTTIADFGHGPRQGGTVSAYPVVFTTGHIYRVTYFGTTNTKSNDVRNFFSGWVYPAVTKLGMFRGQRTTDQFMPSNTVTTALFETEIVDSHSLLDAATGIVTVPAAFNGGFLQLTAGFVAFADNPQLHIQRSVDGGTNWTFEAFMHIPSSGLVGSVESGPIAAVTGEKFRFCGFESGSNFTFTADPRSYFAGTFFKY